MDKKELVVPFHDALRDGDSPSQTYGCRQNNPNICKYNGLSAVCAFVREDHICKQPSRSWKKQYNKLQEERA